MRKKHLFLFTVLFTVMLSACVKPPEYSNVPNIAFVSVNKTAFDEAVNDSLKITIYFEDGDGDLGGTETDSLNMFIGDSRAAPYYFGVKIPFIQLQGNHDDISGNIYYTYDPICLNDTAAVDTFSYDIYIVDRAGNKSNVISTPEMTVICK